MSQMVYGIDIGGTKIEFAVFDNELNQIKSWRIPTPTDNYEKFLDTIEQQILEADQQYGTANPVGIATPGIIDNNGRQLSSNVPCLMDRHLSQDLEQMLSSRSVAIENDCRCFALSEAVLGAGKGYSSVFGAILGTGAAGGFCIDGKLYRSAQNISGEYGHLPIAAWILQKYSLPLWHCGCGMLGCAEPYISGTGLANIYSHYCGQKASTYKWLEALQQGKEEAKQAFDCYMDCVGSMFATITLTYDPEIIVVGGGISLVDEIMDALPNSLTPSIFSGVKPPLIKRAQLGDTSGKYGAAILGLQSYAIQ